MNFLAHCLMADRAADSWNSSEELRQGLLAGAIIGDLTKGPLKPEFPTALNAGIRLHRKIDAWSNRSPRVSACCQRVPPPLRRFAPIFLDIICDHHLSCNWQQMTNANQAVLLERCYEATQEHRGWVSQRGQEFIDFMIQDNLLGGYDDWTNVERGLRSVLRRLNRLELSEALEAFAPGWAESCRGDCEALFNELNTLVDGAQTLLQPTVK